MIVSDYAKKNKNEVLLFKINDNMGDLKRKIGDYDGALKLYKGNLRFSEKNKGIDNHFYITSIMNLANIYNDMQLPDSSMIYNILGASEAIKVKSKRNLNHFNLNSGVSLCLKGEYKEAIDSIEKYIPYYERFKSKRNLSFAYYYCGKAYWEVDSVKKALFYFKKTDTLFKEKGNLFPLLRKNYQYLIDYYKKERDLENHLLYINRLVTLDSILHSQEIYLNKGLIKKYDIPKLKAEKKSVERRLKRNEVTSTYIIVLASFFLILVVTILIYQIRLKKRYKNKFDKILEKPKVVPNINLNERKSQQASIPKKIIDELLTELDSFENKNKFLHNDITLTSLAKTLNTNSNYLSKTINIYKEKSFSNYLNDLRVEYAVERLKIDSIFRKYTIKAIAEDVGFKNAESFSRAFFKLKGLKPSYFLQELDKYNG